MHRPGFLSIFPIYCLLNAQFQYVSFTKTFFITFESQLPHVLLQMHYFISKNLSLFSILYCYLFVAFAMFIYAWLLLFKCYEMRAMVLSMRKEPTSNSFNIHVSQYTAITLLYIFHIYSKCFPVFNFIHFTASKNRNEIPCIIYLNTFVIIRFML